MNNSQQTRTNEHGIDSLYKSIGSIDTNGIMNLLHSTAITIPQAMNELIHNSIDAGADTINCIINENNAIICFSDNGSGMDEEGLKNCFAFFRYNKKNKNGIGCKGAGLKIAGPKLTPNKVFKLFTRKKEGNGWRCLVDSGVDSYDTKSNLCKLYEMTGKEKLNYFKNRTNSSCGTDIEFEFSDAVSKHIKQQFNYEVNIDDDEDNLKFIEEWQYIYANLPVKFNLIINDNIVETIDCNTSELDLERINYDAVNFGVHGRKEYTLIIVYNNEQITKVIVQFNNQYCSWSICKGGSCRHDPKIENKYKPDNKKDSYEKEVKLILASPKFKDAIFNEQSSEMPDGTHKPPASELVDKYYKRNQHDAYNNNQCIKTRNGVRSEIFRIDKYKQSTGKGATETYFKALHTRIAELKYEVSDLSNPNTPDFKFDSIMGTQFNKSQSIADQTKFKPLKYAINWICKQFSDIIWNKMHDMVKDNKNNAACIITRCIRRRGARLTAKKNKEISYNIVNSQEQQHLASDSNTNNLNSSPQSEGKREEDYASDSDTYAQSEGKEEENDVSDTEIDDKSEEKEEEDDASDSDTDAQSEEKQKIKIFYDNCSEFYNNNETIKNDEELKQGLETLLDKLNNLIK